VLELGSKAAPSPLTVDGGPLGRPRAVREWPVRPSGWSRNSEGGGRDGGGRHRPRDRVGPAPARSRVRAPAPATVRG